MNWWLHVASNGAGRRWTGKADVVATDRRRSRQSVQEQVGS